ncbi:Chaperone protein dnaJ 49 [Acorus calamus]|uniref:Chaperone protein dnaJ 49 n=1 Tax=Acorus calamus TaxID=4465 RepID=A0AAV9CKA2_ACOCL|nr:Chaperone protein dnaJ 49 [Acorus calamus]
MTSVVAALVSARPPHNYQPRQAKPCTIRCSSTATLGSSRRETNNNFYKVLSLESENVGAEEIKKAYRTMARRYHPDVCSPSTREESTRMFIELHRAYETLSDPASRRRYDHELGLVGSGSGHRGSGFERERWEEQLRGLWWRSEARRMRRTK